MLSRPTSSPLRHCLRNAAGFALVGLSLSSLSPAHAATGRQYALKRMQTSCDPRLTYTQVQQDPARFTGRVLELRGVVNGIADTSDGCTIVLTTSDGSSLPALELPKSETAVIREMSTPRVRILARVGVGGGGNVVPLVVLAVAHESEVRAQETEAAQRGLARQQQAEAARQERLHFRNEVLRTSRGSRNNAVASRGLLRGGRGQDGGFGEGGSAALNGGMAGALPGGGAEEQAAFYVPKLGPRTQNLFPAYFDWLQSHKPGLDPTTLGLITFHLLFWSEREVIDPRLVVSMVVAESDFNPRSTSHSGAMGLGQLMPETARSLGLTDAYDIGQNLQGAIQYLKSRLKAFGDDNLTWPQIRLALAAYNAGMGAVKRYGGIPPYRQTQAYVKRIEQYYRSLCPESRQ